MIQTKEISLQELQSNTGQIDGLPKNPRFLKDAKYQKLKQSIEEAPEMLQLRELIVIPFAGSYVVIAGNMRLKVMQELGYETAICKVLPENTPAEKLREYTVKDNISYGQMDWEIVQADWDIEELHDWGEDVPKWLDEDQQEKEVEYVEAKNWYINIKCNNEDEAQELYEQLLNQGHDVKILN